MGNGKEVEDYMGVILPKTAYKVYVAILVERLRKKVEGIGLLPASQTGFL